MDQRTCEERRTSSPRCLLRNCRPLGAAVALVSQSGSWPVHAAQFITTLNVCSVIFPTEEIGTKAALALLPQDHFLSVSSRSAVLTQLRKIRRDREGRQRPCSQRTPFSLFPSVPPTSASTDFLPGVQGERDLRRRNNEPPLNAVDEPSRGAVLVGCSRHARVPREGSLSPSACVHGDSGRP